MSEVNPYRVHERAQYHSAVHTAASHHDVCSQVQAALNGHSAVGSTNNMVFNLPQTRLVIAHSRCLCFCGISKSRAVPGGTTGGLTQGQEVLPKVGIHAVERFREGLLSV